MYHYLYLAGSSVSALRSLERAGSGGTMTTGLQVEQHGGVNTSGLLGAIQSATIDAYQACMEQSALYGIGVISVTTSKQGGHLRLDIQCLAPDQVGDIEDIKKPTSKVGS